jgi:ABC-2 type transport system permease protein
MKKVMRLVSVQLWAMLGSMLAIGENKKKKTRALYAGFIIFIIIMSGLSFFYAYVMGISLRLFDSIELMPSLFMALTSVIVLFTTINKVKGTLFGFKDYDMVMSLPVSNSKIVASRLILLYSINLVFVLIIMIPMMIAYGILAQPGGYFYINSILMVLFIPLIPIIIASFLGTILTYVSMRFRYSNIVYMVITFSLLIAMIIVPTFMRDSEQALVEISQNITKQIDRIYPLSNLYSKAVTKGDIISMFIFMAISILAFIVFSLAVGKVFKRINSVVMTGRSKSNYKLGELKSYSPLKALYRKDFKRYFASTIYVMNTGFGVVMMVLGTIALPFIDLSAIAGEINIQGTIKDIIPLFVCFCIATSCTTMASISIEGKHLWITKSLPVSETMIFASKILVNLTILAPVILASVFICITMQIPFINSILIVLSAAFFSVFISLYGLVINLSFPNLTWTHEAIIVKQSTASLICVFSGIGMIVILYLLLMITGNSLIAMLLFICLLLVLSLLLYKRLLNGARKQFVKL